MWVILFQLAQPCSEMLSHVVFQMSISYFHACNCFHPVPSPEAWPFNMQCDHSNLAYGEVGGHLVKFSPSKVLITPLWLQKCSNFDLILFYLFYLCTNQNLEVGFRFFSLCSSFWYASRIDKVKFSCVLCIKYQATWIDSPICNISGCPNDCTK